MQCGSQELTKCRHRMPERHSTKYLEMEERLAHPESGVQASRGPNSVCACAKAVMGMGMVLVVAVLLLLLLWVRVRVNVRGVSGCMDIRTCPRHAEYASTSVRLHSRLRRYCTQRMGRVELWLGRRIPCLWMLVRGRVVAPSHVATCAELTREHRPCRRRLGRCGRLCLHLCRRLRRLDRRWPNAGAGCGRGTDHVASKRSPGPD